MRLNRPLWRGRSRAHSSLGASEFLFAIIWYLGSALLLPGSIGVGQNPPLDHEAIKTNFPVGQVGAQDFILGIKIMEQGVSPPSARHLQLLAGSRSALFSGGGTQSGP